MSDPNSQTSENNLRIVPKQGYDEYLHDEKDFSNEEDDVDWEFLRYPQWQSLKTNVNCGHESWR